jgi:hypothetical protein
VIDEIVCLNPQDRTKGGKRELDRLHPLLQRIQRWEKVRDARGLKGEAIGKAVYRTVPLSGSKYVTSMLRAAVTRAASSPRRLGRKVKDAIRSLRRRDSSPRAPRPV